MQMPTTETIKTLTTIITPLLTLIIIPLVKKIASIKKTFFSLPTEKKIEAIDYILTYSSSENPLKKLKHEIKMGDFKLHSNINLSIKIIRFYADDYFNNIGLAKTLLLAKGIYIYRDDKIKIRKATLLVPLIFAALSVFMLYSSVILFNSKDGITSNLISAYVLLSCGLAYLFFTLLFLHSFSTIIWNKRKFNKFSSKIKDDNIIPISHSSNS
ncbi:MAG: hypothetical protein QM578_07510 [Pantoea sp.]|uniref:hypothetical protein n=1 Tax=Pantoea sp. TaxID=69393 RepID=UPI0039E3F99F